MVTLLGAGGCSLYFGGDEPAATPDAQTVSPPDVNIATPPRTCVADADCGADVCTAGRTCAAPTSLRNLTVHWYYDDFATSYGCRRSGVTSIVLLINPQQPDLRWSIDCDLGAYEIKNVPKAVHGVYTERPGETYVPDGECGRNRGFHATDSFGYAEFDLRGIDRQIYCTQ